MSTVFRPMVRGISFIGVSQILTRIVSLASVTIITRAISAQDYGVAVLALTVTGPVFAFVGLGLDDVLVSTALRLHGEKQDEKSTRLVFAFGLMKCIGLIISVVGLAFVSTILGKQYAAIVNQFLLPLQIWIIASVARTYIDNLLEVKMYFGKFAVANVVETVGKLLAVIWFFLNHDLSVATILWSYVIGKIIGVILVFSELKTPVFVSEKINGVRDLFSLIKLRGKWEILRNGVLQMFSGVDMWVIGIFCGLKSIAIFSIASTMISFFTNMLPLRRVIFPILSKLSGDSIAGSIVARRMTKYTFWINSLMVICGAVAVPFVLPLFFPKYILSIPIFYFLLPNLLLNGLSGGHGPLMYARGEQRYLLGLGIFGIISSITILPLFAWLFGIYGAVIENLITTGIIIFLREKRLREKHQIQTISFRDLITIDSMDRSVFRRLYSKIPLLKHAQNP